MTEFLSPEGLRVDGRRPEELRIIKCKLGVFSQADGSAYFQQGNTKIIASVFGPREVSVRRKALHDRALIKCDYSMAFSTGEKRRNKKKDRRSAEISLVIRQTFESVIMTNQFPRSQIDIHIQVLQADGGTRCAAINAATLALINAGVPMKDMVCACAAGCIDGTPILGIDGVTRTLPNHLLIYQFHSLFHDSIGTAYWYSIDLNYVEDSAGGPDMPVAVLPQSGKIVMVQMDSKLPLELFEKVLDLAVEGANAIYQVLQREVERYTAERTKN